MNSKGYENEHMGICNCVTKKLIIDLRNILLITAIIDTNVSGAATKS